VFEIETTYLFSFVLVLRPSLGFFIYFAMTSIIIYSSDTFSQIPIY